MAVCTSSLVRLALHFYTRSLHLPLDAIEEGCQMTTVRIILYLPNESRTPLLSGVLLHNKYGKALLYMCIMVKGPSEVLSLCYQEDGAVVS